MTQSELRAIFKPSIVKKSDGYYWSDGRPFHTDAMREELKKYHNIQSTTKEYKKQWYLDNANRIKISQSERYYKDVIITKRRPPYSELIDSSHALNDIKTVAQV